MNSVVIEGVNTFGNVQFKVDDLTKATEEAKKDAIEKAKAEVEMVEENTDLKFKRIIGYYEYTDQYAKGGIAPRMMMTESMNKDGGPIIEPGQQEITVNVSLIYEVN